MILDLSSPQSDKSKITTVAAAGGAGWLATVAAAGGAGWLPTLAAAGGRLAGRVGREN